MPKNGTEGDAQTGRTLFAPPSPQLDLDNGRERQEANRMGTTLLPVGLVELALLTTT